MRTCSYRQACRCQTCALCCLRVINVLMIDSPPSHVTVMQPFLFLAPSLIWWLALTQLMFVPFTQVTSDTHMIVQVDYESPKAYPYHVTIHIDITIITHVTHYLTVITIIMEYSRMTQLWPYSMAITAKQFESKTTNAQDNPSDNLWWFRIAMILTYVHSCA